MSEKVSKTFVFEKEDTQQSSIVDYTVETRSEYIDLSEVLQAHCPLSEFRISIYNPHTQRFSILSSLAKDDFLIPAFIFEPFFILIRYIEKGQLLVDSESINSGGQLTGKNDEKQVRSKERTIGEAIQVVKKWRQLHQHGCTITKKRLNLQEAARVMGVSKKSLDDYYCQLRLGQLYHFDYINNLDQKMGYLRTYVKNYRPEKQPSNRRQHDKHPKNLKILNYYDIETHGLTNIEEMIKEQEYAVLKVQQPEPIAQQVQQKEAQVIPEPVQQLILEPLASIEEFSATKRIFNLEDCFFKDFQIPLDLQGDPYYELERDFRKKDMDFDSNSLLFFD